MISERINIMIKCEDDDDDNGYCGLMKLDDECSNGPFSKKV